MIESLVRKARQLGRDRVLRRWLIQRALGLTAGEPSFTPHRPPYLDGLLPLEVEAPGNYPTYAGLADGPPTAPIRLELPGQTIAVDPGGESALFKKTFNDTETLLALHRFAWLPLSGKNVDPAWVQALWSAWRGQFGEPSDGWPWHPYTAAERAINILDYAAKVGLPSPVDDTVNVLAAHGPAIAGRLEYFGDHHTSNHLSNNGRGLYRLGLELGLERAADLGRRILINEAERIFSGSGILREGSSHYHLLLCRNYADAWRAARDHQDTGETQLRTIAVKALAALPALRLPGGMPLVGDISPDCMPNYLIGWLDDVIRQDFPNLSQSEPSPESLRSDGWLRADFWPWSGLWHCAPGGWSMMPGHGHQDCGGFELHYKDQPVFIDPGRGAYGDSGEAALYRSGRVHNTLLVDGNDQYPANKPYYDEGFRRAIAGAPPQMSADDEAVVVKYSDVSRQWRFNSTGFTISDSVEGTGRHTLSRLLHTAMDVRSDAGGVILGGKLRISCEGEITIRPITRWLAYGRGVDASVLEITIVADLPWQGTITVEVVE